MRSLLVLMLIGACGGRAAHPTTPTVTTSTPARDLSIAKNEAPPHTGDSHLVAKDPRVTDLDIIRITATSKGVGGDPQLDHVATADLFRQANEAAKVGETEKAITL